MCCHASQSGKSSLKRPVVSGKTMLLFMQMLQKHPASNRERYCNANICFTFGVFQKSGIFLYLVQTFSIVKTLFKHYLVCQCPKTSVFVSTPYTYMGAACKLDNLMSVVFLEGESSSTGEMKPSVSSSSWSRSPSMLSSGLTVTVNCVLVSLSSSEPSSSSWKRADGAGQLNCSLTSRVYTSMIEQYQA